MDITIDELKKTATKTLKVRFLDFDVLIHIEIPKENYELLGEKVFDDIVPIQFTNKKS